MDDDAAADMDNDDDIDNGVTIAAHLLPKVIHISEQARTEMHGLMGYHITKLQPNRQTRVDIS